MVDYNNKDGVARRNVQRHRLMETVDDRFLLYLMNQIMGPYLQNIEKLSRQAEGALEKNIREYNSKRMKIHLRMAELDLEEYRKGLSFNTTINLVLGLI